MDAIAKGKYLRCSSQKMRAVADLIREKSVETAMAQLYVLGKHKKTARFLDKVLKSAVANLQEKNADKQVETEDLKIKSITVDKGPHIKRIRARAQGRAFRINKNMCHLTVAITD